MLELLPLALIFVFSQLVFLKISYSLAEPNSRLRTSFDKLEYSFQIIFDMTQSKIAVISIGLFSLSLLIIILLFEYYLAASILGWIFKIDPKITLLGLIFIYLLNTIVGSKEQNTLDD